MTGDSTAGSIANAARLLLDEEGVEAVTMRRVARGVGLTAMAIYRHYPDRKGLLNALVDEGFRELSEQLRTTTLTGGLEARILKALDVFLTFALRTPRLFELMFLTPREGARQYPHDFKAGKSPTANLMADLLKEGMATGHFRREDVWPIVFETGALFQGLTMLYLGGRMDMSATRFRVFCRRSIKRYLRGIRK
jgi:AcrR family transcriptional regulator